MSFMGNGITNCYPDEVDNFISITVLRAVIDIRVGAKIDSVFHHMGSMV